MVDVNNIANLITIFFKFFGAFVNVIFTFYLVTIVSNERAGEVFFLISVIFLSATFSRIGLETYILKSIGRVTNALVRVRRLNIFISFQLVNFVFFFCLLGLGTYCFDAHLFYQLVVILPLAFLMNTSQIISYYFQAIGRSFVAVISLNVIFYSLLLFLYRIFSDSVESDLLLIYFAVILLTAFSFLFLHNVRFRLIFNFRIYFVLLKVLFPFYVFSIYSQSILWMAIFSLGLLSTSELVSEFTFYQRLTMVVTLVLTAVNMIYAPKFSRYYYSSDRPKLLCSIKACYKYIYALTIPITFSIFFFGFNILDFLDISHSNNTSLFNVLLLSQLFNVLTGPVGYFLSMCGFQRVLFFNCLFSFLLLLLSNFLLTMSYGLIGCALSLALVSFIHNGINVYFVFRRIVIPLFKGADGV